MGYTVRYAVGDTLGYIMGMDGWSGQGHLDGSTGCQLYW